MAVAAVHRIGARSEWLALATAVGGITGMLAIDDVRRDRQHALGMRRSAIGLVLADLLHELRDKVGSDAVDPVIVVAELRDRRAAFVHIVDG